MKQTSDEKITVLKKLIDVLDLIANTSGGVKHEGERNSESSLAKRIAQSETIGRGLIQWSERQPGKGGFPLTGDGELEDRSCSSFVIFTDRR